MKSTRLTNRDVRQIGELVGQAKDLGGDATAWRTHAVQGLIRLVGGQLGLTLDTTGAVPGNIPVPVDPIDIGWFSRGDRQVYLNYYQREVVDDPGSTVLLRLHQDVRLVTATREQLIPDRTWYASAAVSDLRRSTRLDDFVSTSVALRPGVLHGFVVYRPWGDRRFGGRERRALRLFHLWLFHAYRRGPATTAAGAEVDALPPRVRQVLGLLLAGHGVKDAAARMGVSWHTAAGYAKTLHRRLGVSTRGELLQRYLPRSPGLTLPAGLAEPTPADVAHRG